MLNPDKTGKTAQLIVSIGRTKWYNLGITPEELARIEEIEKTEGRERLDLLEKYFPFPTDWNYGEYDPNSASIHIAMNLFHKAARGYYEDFPELESDDALKGLFAELNDMVYYWFYNRIKDIGSIDTPTFTSNLAKVIERIAWQSRQKKQTA